jgi:hypothetical protein
MGGLVSRYYLESGDFSGQPGFNQIQDVVLLATPSHGSVAALTSILGLRSNYFLTKDQVKQIASDPRYPSVYELLPHEGAPFLWSSMPGAGLPDLDLYDPATIASLGLASQSVQVAVAFHKRLDLDKRPSGVRYFVFAGTQFPTTSACLCAVPPTASSVVALQPDDAGDGTVPVWGSHLAGIQRIEIGGSHPTIYKDEGFQGFLARLLGRESEALPDVETLREFAEPEAAPPMTMSVRDQVVEHASSTPDESSIIHIALGLAGRAMTANSRAAAIAHAALAAAGPAAGPTTGQVRLEPVQLDSVGQVRSIAPAVAAVDTSLPSHTTPRVNLALLAPAQRGLYRVALYTLQPAGAPAAGRMRPAAVDFVAVA